MIIKGTRENIKFLLILQQEFLPLLDKKERSRSSLSFFQ